MFKYMKHETMYIIYRTIVSLNIPQLYTFTSFFIASLIKPHFSLYINFAGNLHVPLSYTAKRVNYVCM